jgi:hypothetical protein
VCLDIGRSDATAIVFYQRIGRELRIIDYYANRFKDASHYAHLLKEQKPYLYAKTILPHDAAAEHFTATETTERYFQRVGMKAVTIAPKLSVQAGIDMGRRLFSRLVFDETACNMVQQDGLPSFLESLENYRRAWDDVTKDYRGDPIHDKYSHGADAFRTGVVGGMDTPLEYRETGDMQRTVRSGWEPLDALPAGRSRHAIEAW